MYVTRNPAGDVTFAAPATDKGLGVYPVPGTAGVLPPAARVPIGGQARVGLHAGSTFDLRPVHLSLGASYAAAPQDAAYQTPLLVGGARWSAAIGTDIEIARGWSLLSSAAVTVSRSSGGGGLGAATGVPCVRGDTRGSACGDGSEIYRSIDAKNLGTADHRALYGALGLRIAL